MLDDGTYYLWNKDEDTQLSTHFSTTEYTCHCTNVSCKQQKIAKAVISRNESIRNALGAPVTIRSGYRCPAYQAMLAHMGLETAKGVSQHTLGNASDISAQDMSALLALCERFYTAIGVARSFIHVDTRAPHADGTPRRWSYLKS